jgi:tetratricopeptide (TPR) repeat protein
VWQRLYDELQDRDFVVITIAMDSLGADAARQWIEAAEPAHPSLVDRDHVVSELFNMVNVPMAVWIDERGRIVRPAEYAGTNDAFRGQDRETGAWSDDSFQEMRRARLVYLAALRDWAEHGAASEYAWDEEQARQHLRAPSEDTTLANAHFRIGQYLRRQGQFDEGERFLEEAKRLAPDNWNIWRQAWNLEGAPTSEFWARVDALGERRYSLPIDMAGIE